MIIICHWEKEEEKGDEERKRGEKGLNETNDDYRMVNTLAEAEPAVKDVAWL